MPALLHCKEEVVIQVLTGQARRPHPEVIKPLTSSFSYPRRVRVWGYQVSNARGTCPPTRTPAGPRGEALGLHLKSSEQAAFGYCRKSIYKRQGGIFTAEKSPAAIGSGEHQLFVLLKCILWSVVLPRCPKAAPWDSPGSAPRFAGQRAASSPSRYPTWYRSRQRLLDNVTADAQLVQTSQQAGRS